MESFVHKISSSFNSSPPSDAADVDEDEEMPRNRSEDGDRR